MRIHWTARRSNQSILKEISPQYSLEGLILMLKLQYFGHLMQRTDSYEKTLMLGKIEGGRRSPSYLVRNPILAPHLEKMHKTPLSSRDEDLLFLHGLESNPESSLQTPQGA